MIKKFQAGLSGFIRLLRCFAASRGARRSFKGDPVIYFDVGSAGYMPLVLRMLHRDNVLSPIGFDPSPTNWEFSIQDWLDRFLRLPKLVHEPVALGERDGTAILYVTSHPGCSSLFRPDAAALARFEAAPLFDVVKELPVQLRRMDTYVAGRGLPSPEIVKMDVQGAESLVLAGMGDLLEKVVCLEFETRMRPLYQGEWVFSDYYAFLRGKGFDLLKLEQHQTLEDESIEYMAYFGRTPRNEREELVRRIFMSANDINLISGYHALLAREGHLLRPKPTV